MIQDLRDGLRALASAPLVSAAAILSLALGIGAAAAVFSVIDGVLLKPLPVRDQDRVLVVWKSLPDRNMADWPFEYRSYEAMRDRVRTLSGLAAHPYSGTVGDVAYLDANATPLMWTFVTGGWFDVLGVPPAAGRLLASSDDGAGAEPVMVISRGAAVRLFGDVQSAVGRRLRIWATTYTVVGVTTADFAYPKGAEAWLPVSGARTSGFLAWHLVGRMAPGLSIQQVQTDLQRALSSLPREGEALVGAIQIATFADAVIGNARPALLMLGAAVLLMLVIAGANVANLLLVRGLSRRRELAVRTAIGASRGRLVRLLAAESSMIVGLAAIVAILVSYAVLGVLLTLAPPELPRVSAVGIDGRVLFFVAGVAGACAVLVGMIPAVQTAVIRPADALRMLGSDANGASRDWLRHGLVVGQVALTTLVLSMAGLLLKSFDRLQRLDLGFGAEQVVLAQVDLATTSGPADMQRRMMRLSEEVATMPGIVGATAVATAPFAGNQGVDALMYAESQAMPQEATPFSNYEGVDKAYFTTLGLPVLSGRGIDERDTADSQLVIAINEAFAQLFWPGRDPIGRRVRLGDDPAVEPWRTVVGLVADARYRDLTTVRPSVYVPYSQGIPVSPQYVAVRARSVVGVGPAVARAIANQEPGAAVLSLTPLPSLLAAPLARPRFQSALVASFAGLALTLAVVGTYGTLSFFVRQRTREFGIRMALGADAARIRTFVLRKGAIIGLLGVGAGLGAASLAEPLAEPLLFGVAATDPVVLAGTAVVLLTAVVAAALVPAVLASRTSPMVVMRGE
jgi:predicted permease